MLKIGIVGTGYAAQKRAEAVQSDGRSKLLFVSGSNLEKTTEFCQQFGGYPLAKWQELVSNSELDLIIVSTINRDHGLMVKAALEAHKHVIVEYPLSLDYTEAENLVKLAKINQKMLHVEHIELLGGIHQTLKQYLPELGAISYASYTTINPEYPVSKSWKYNYQMFGFPFMAALSRIHRLTDLFGKVASVSGKSRFWNTDNQEYYRSCLSVAQLEFNDGLIANLVYGKGETFNQVKRTFELHGEQGNILFEGQQGTLIKGEKKLALEVANRRGLFLQDTQMVLDHLLEEKPLYVSPEASLYALKIADAARYSSEMGQTIIIDN